MPLVLGCCTGTSSLLNPFREVFHQPSPPMELRPSTSSLAESSRDRGVLEEEQEGVNAMAGAQHTLSSWPQLRLQALNGKREINQGENTGKWQSSSGFGSPGGGPTWLMEEHPRLLSTAEFVGEGVGSAGSEGRVSLEHSQGCRMAPGDGAATTPGAPARAQSSNHPPF